MDKSTTIRVDDINVDILINTLLDRISALERLNDFYITKCRRIESEIAALSGKYNPDDVIEDGDLDG